MPSSPALASTAILADLRGAIGKVASGNSLTQDEAAEAFELMMSGAATPAQIGGLLMALRVRGETVDEIAGAARAMRAKVLTIRAPDGAIDTCGTGGDGEGQLQHLDLRCLRGGGRRRASGQARQPVDLLAVGLGGCARRARRQYRLPRPRRSRVASPNAG